MSTVSTILLVEDNEDHAALLDRYFDERDEMSLLRAASLRDLRRILEEQAVHLIITDLKLPDGNGMELFDDESYAAGIPVVVMTSYGDEQSAVEAMKRGAMDYVVKSPEAFAGMPSLAGRVLREWNHKQKREIAESRLSESLQEKEVLLQEVHHRVKNNFQIISSLLRLQADYIEDSQARRLFLESYQRIQTMAMIHENLYQSEDFARIHFQEYVSELLARIKRFVTGEFMPQGAGDITYDAESPDLYLELERAVPLALILNELATDMSRRVLSDGGGNVSVRIREKDEYYKIELSCDESPDENADSAAVSQEEGSLGTQLVQLLADQIDAHIQRGKTGLGETGKAGSSKFVEISFPRRGTEAEGPGQTGPNKPARDSTPLER
jgi:two-component sensor histidine kinase